MRRKKVTQATATATRVCPVQVALEAAHTVAARVGRPLFPIEVRWVVRHAFRTRYALNSKQADQFADVTIERIRQMVEGESA